MEPRDEINRLRSDFEARLAAAADRLGGPRVLGRAAAHSLLSGGKRLRPLIAIGASRLQGEPPLDPMPAACALEFVHTYSLVHDDLPAMDNDTLRRGAPTCHVAFGEAVAILAGDALLTEAFALVCDGYRDAPAAAARIAGELAGAAGAGGMVGGQVLDVLKERDPAQLARDGEEAGIARVHALKTGALIRASFVIGGIAGGLPGEELGRLARCGEMVGLAFQIVDDCLDATATAAQLGKSAGSDARHGKETFASLMGVAKARAEAARLEREALAVVDVYGERGGVLRELVRLSVERRS